MRITTLCLLVLCPFAPGNAADEWATDVNKMLTEFMSCTTPIDDVSPCNVFLSRALGRVYGVHDFETAGSGSGHMSANQIANKVAEASSNWTKLGAGDSQSALDEAQGYANLKKAVIAVYKAEPHGHVALILPGSQAMSSTWGLKVPNSASFFFNDPKSSYVGKPLSTAFGADKKASVILYGRNF